jgi:multidrug efflux pump
MALNKYGIGLEQVRGVLNNSNANVPKGHFSDGFHLWEVGANDQMFKAKDYRPLIVAYNNGAAVRLSMSRTSSIRWRICAIWDTRTASLR